MGYPAGGLRFSFWVLLYMTWVACISSAAHVIPAADLVFTIPCSTDRLRMALTSRVWRKGMRAAFVLQTNEVSDQLRKDAEQHNETFLSFPDFHQTPNAKHRHYMPGDRRAAMAPLLAYMHLGPSFKWMLYGDDDTIFFQYGISTMVAGLDPEQPYILSDMLYEGSVCPKPRCWELACRACVSPQPTSAQSRKLRGDSPCPPCDVQTLCHSRFASQAEQCIHEWEGMVPYGGTGMLISVGVFKQLLASHTKEEFELCVMNTTIADFPQGGDAIFSRCMWKFGFPMTLPPHNPMGRWFGDILHVEDFLNATSTVALEDKASVLEPKWRNGVAVHLEARMMKSWKHAFLLSRHIAQTYDAVADFLWGERRL